MALFIVPILTRNEVDSNMAYFRKRDNGWEYRISYKDATGKYRQKSKSGFKTKALASAAASKAELELLAGTPATNKDVTFSQYFKEWVDTHKRPGSAIGTIKGYEVTQKALDKYFQTLKLRDMTPTLYQKILNKMGEHYAKNTLYKHHHKFRSCVKHAIADGIVDRNFTDLAKINSIVAGKDTKENYLEEDEYLRLIDYLYSEPFKYRNIQMYLLAVTGMRVGESMGLTWNDIDLENGIIDINKTWDVVRNDRFAPTKNQQSIRQIPINTKLVDLLQEYRATIGKIINTIDYSHKLQQLILTGG